MCVCVFIYLSIFVQPAEVKENWKRVVYDSIFMNMGNSIFNDTLNTVLTMATSMLEIIYEKNTRGSLLGIELDQRAGARWLQDKAIRAPIFSKHKLSRTYCRHLFNKHLPNSWSHIKTVCQNCIITPVMSEFFLSLVLFWNNHYRFNEKFG